MDMQQAIRQLVGGHDFSRTEMRDVMGIIMAGNATASQIGAFLVALNIKGETVEEIVGAAQAMRALVARVEVPGIEVVDTVGTGGDHASLFNVSTASAFVAAEAGVVIAKHGNRAATGKSGSFDALEAAGVYIELKPDQVAQCIRALGIGFMFAPLHHGATRHAVGPRREIGVRSIFNVLGPLTNPAGATRQLVGVFDARWLRPIAEVLRELGSRVSLVVHSDDGLDEISIAAATHAVELRDGQLTERVIRPADFGIEAGDLASLKVDDGAGSLALMRAALAGESGPAFDMVALNAGATIYAGEGAATLAQGVDLARDILRSGAGLAKLEALVSFTQRFRPADDCRTVPAIDKVMDR